MRRWIKLSRISEMTRVDLPAPLPPPRGPQSTVNPGSPGETGDPPPNPPPREEFALSKSLADIVNEMNNVPSPVATPAEVLEMRDTIKTLNYRLVNVTRERDGATRALRRILGIAADRAGTETDFDKTDDLLTALGLETDY